MLTPTPTQRREPRAVFRFDEFNKLVEPKGRVSLRSKAEFLGVPHTVLSRLARNSQTPSAEFIAAVKLAFPHVNIERLFTFTAEPRDRGGVIDKAA